MSKQTISDEYLKLQSDLHKNPDYGEASIGYAPVVKNIMLATKSKSLSDYGAGKMNLKKAIDASGPIPFDYFPYDPVFPEYGEPKPGDLVCCIDVLEHVEPDYLDTVLDDLASITHRLGFFTIATRPAQKILSDGRNAHLIQKPSSWWLPRLCERFEITGLQSHADHGFWVLVKPKIPSAGN